MTTADRHPPAAAIVTIRRPSRFGVAGDLMPEERKRRMPLMP
jgi:hypothetical protein